MGEELTRRSIAFLELVGEHAADVRERNVQKFQETDVPIFLISLRAGGEGLNLTKADAVIIYDPWWTPSKETQAIDRAHRIGQLNSVSVFRFIARGTVEERMVDLQRRKQAISDMILESDRDIINLLNEEDVNRLFEPMSNFPEEDEVTADTDLEMAMEI